MNREKDYRSAVMHEARTLAAFLVDIERGKCGGDVDLALHRAAQIWGIEESALRSLRYRWRELQDVRASTLERMREAYEEVYERQRQREIIERQIDEKVSSVPTHDETMENTAVEEVPEYT